VIDRAPRNSTLATSAPAADHDRTPPHGGGLLVNFLEETLEVHEVHEQAEQAHHKNNKRAAILIVGLAATLAIVEMAGKEALFASIAQNIETSDTYAFYQAKTIRSTMVRTALEAAELLPADGVPEKTVATREKQVGAWQKAVERLDSDPATKEGRKELLERAKQITEVRDHEIHAYHDFEYGAAALQLAIVMASAAVITELSLLEVVSAGLGLIGLAFGLMGWFAPALLNL
jgi:hypothetical protein